MYANSYLCKEVKMGIGKKKELKRVRMNPWVLVLRAANETCNRW